MIARVDDDGNLHLKNILGEWEIIRDYQVLKLVERLNNLQGQLDGAIKERMRAEIELEDANEALEQFDKLLEMAHNRERPYIKMWRKETGNWTTSPDYGVFVEWLISKIENQKG